MILGLLTGGILTGQSLIKASELRSVSVDFQKHTAAIQTFRDKYMALPGDMPNAVRFWGRHPAMPTDNCTTVVADWVAWNSDIARRETCNGNGDGMFLDWTKFEQLVAWQHLSNAGLLEGQYKGGRGGGSGMTVQVPGVHIPASKLSHVSDSTGHFGGPTAMVFAINPNITGGGSLGIEYTPRSLAEAGADNSQRTLVFGGLIGPTVQAYVSLGMRPEDAWNIDTKMDDGRPSAGRLIAPTIVAGQPRCVTNATEANEYNLANMRGDCHLILRNAF